MRGPMLWLQCSHSSAHSERVRVNLRHGTSLSCTGSSSIDDVGAGTSGNSATEKKYEVKYLGCSAAVRGAVG